MYVLTLVGSVHWQLSVTNDCRREERERESREVKQESERGER